MSESRLLGTVEVLKALAHPARLRLLAMLESGGLCVCQLTAVLGLAVSTVSAHLAELRRAGLVAEQKEGRFVSYRLAEGARTSALLAQVRALASPDAALEADAVLVRRLRRVPVEALCQVDLDLTRLGLARRTPPKGVLPWKPARS
jgi:DNA-binding transcriptional ArsR family regulator